MQYVKHNCFLQTNHCPFIKNTQLLFVFHFIRTFLICRFSLSYFTAFSRASETTVHERSRMSLLQTWCQNDRRCHSTLDKNTNNFTCYNINNFFIWFDFCCFRWPYKNHLVYLHIQCDFINTRCSHRLSYRWHVDI